MERREFIKRSSPTSHLQFFPLYPGKPPGPPSATPPSSPDIFVMEISATHLRHDAVDLSSEARGEAIPGECPEVPVCAVSETLS